MLNFRHLGSIFMRTCISPSWLVCRMFKRGCILILQPAILRGSPAEALEWQFQHHIHRLHRSFLLGVSSSNAFTSILSASTVLPSTTASAADGWLSFLGIDAKGRDKSWRSWMSDLGGISGFICLIGFTRYVGLLTLHIYVFACKNLCGWIGTRLVMCVELCWFTYSYLLWPF